MKKYLFLIFLLFLASLNFNFFLKPNQLITGGTNGLALIIEHFTSINSSNIILFLNITFLLISHYFLEPSYTNSAFYSSLIYPILIKLTSHLNIPFTLPILITSLISGLIYGITGGLIYSLGFSSGGITILNLLVQKYLHIKISLSTFISNLLIILFGIICFGLKKSIFSIIIISLGSTTIYFILKNKKLRVS